MRKASHTAAVTCFVVALVGEIGLNGARSPLDAGETRKLPIRQEPQAPDR